MHCEINFCTVVLNVVDLFSYVPVIYLFSFVYEFGQVEEEEYQDNCETVRQDKLSDLKLSLCRNVGDSSNRVVKRKISWQDPVALRV